MLVLVKLRRNAWCLLKLFCAQVAACLCGSYIGGSINFSAIAAGLGVSGSSLVAAMTAGKLASASCKYHVSSTIANIFSVILSLVPLASEPPNSSNAAADITIMACYLGVLGTIPAELESRSQEEKAQKLSSPHAGGLFCNRNLTINNLQSHVFVGNYLCLSNNCNDQAEVVPLC